MMCLVASRQLCSKQTLVLLNVGSKCTFSGVQRMSHKFVQDHYPLLPVSVVHLLLSLGVSLCKPDGYIIPHEVIGTKAESQRLVLHPYLAH